VQADLEDKLTRARAHYAAELGLGRGLVRALAVGIVATSLAAIAAGSWAVWVTWQAAARIERYVVFLDDAGTAVRVDLARDDWTPQKGIWADTAARWVRNLRSRPVDVPTLKFQREQVIQTSSRETFDGLRAWMLQADRDMEHSAVDVELVSVNVVSSDERRATVLVRWRERERRVAMLGAWQSMTGTVALVLDPPKVREELQRNPPGIFVVDFSFSREAG
jgi:type IV secretory pathway TrbF-like protein